MTTDEEIQREINEELARPRYAPPLPRQPPTPPVMAGPMGQLNELMAVMVSMETYKEKLLQNERSRETAVETRLRARLQQEIVGTATEEMDPGVKMALEVLVEAFKQSVVVPPSNTTPAPIVQPEQQTEAPMQPYKSVEDTAEEIFSKFPNEVKKIASGEISKEQAINLASLYTRMTPAQIEDVYNYIVATDWDAPPEEPTGVKP